MSNPKRPIPKGKKPGKSKEPSKESETRRNELGKRAYEAERREKAQPSRTVMSRLFAAMNWRSNSLRKTRAEMSQKEIDEWNKKHGK